MTLILRRFIAYILDKMILLIFYFLASSLSLFFPILWEKMTRLPLFGIWFFLSLLCANLFYHAFFESSSWRATLGKKWLKLQVSTIENQTLSFFQSIFRQILQFFLLPLFFIGFFFSPRSTQMSHDRASRSKVQLVPSLANPSFPVENNKRENL